MLINSLTNVSTTVMSPDIHFINKLRRMKILYTASLAAWLFLAFSFSSFAQSWQLVAQKNKRIFHFQAGEKYLFVAKNIHQKFVQQRGTFSTLNDSMLVLTHKKGTDTISVQNIISVHNYRSFKARAVSFLQIALGAGLVAATITNAQGFMDALFITSGVLFAAEGTMSLIGWDDWNTSFRRPSTEHGFEFNLEKRVTSNYAGIYHFTNLKSVTNCTGLLALS